MEAKGYIGGLSTALQNAVDKPLMPVGLSKLSCLLEPIFIEICRVDCTVNITDFNLKIKEMNIEKLASLYNIHFRTGCFCNAGACQKLIGLSSDEVKRNLKAGHICGDEMDVIDGQPTGSVRISFGFMSTFDDAKTFLKFIVDTFIKRSSRDNVQIVDYEKFSQASVSQLVSNEEESMNGSRKILSNTMETRSHVFSNLSRVEPTCTCKERENMTANNKAITLSHIYLYPIKSCAAFQGRPGDATFPSFINIQPPLTLCQTAAMGSSKQLPSNLKMKIVEAHKAGEGCKKIAKHFQVSLSSVRNVMKKWQLTGPLEVKIRSGRPSKISVRAAHRIARDANQNPHLTEKDLQKYLVDSGVVTCYCTHICFGSSEAL
ncbi:unnamed protein product [Ranitomeya imitator]|uniref:Insertion element IS150 protein InsJ-like helix-turn-helix domain-containing protein n=1 Tax=Ranitomeya imitator TaxID=111125 RepID=A0ABN9LJY4_9NEOB|nr:unnamed protein product [Ranitomeya imitator]